MVFLEVLKQLLFHFHLDLHKVRYLHSFKNCIPLSLVLLVFTMLPFLEGGPVNWEAHPAILRLADHVDLRHNCGFVTMVSLGSYGSVEEKGKIGATIKPSEFSSNSLSERGPSPVNGITDIECANILREEVDSLKLGTDNVSLWEIHISCQCTKLMNTSVCIHTSNSSCVWICVLNVLQEDEGKSTEQSQSHLSFKHGSGVLNSSLADQMSEKLKLSLPSQQFNTTGSSDAWTLLDCCFGVPLFDVEANKQICDSITSCGLWEHER